jgi:hypothetical protein
MSGARIAKAFLAVAASVFLAWWIIKSSAVDALVRRNPLAAAAIAPDHPQVRVGLAMLEFRLRGGALTEEGRRSALAALAQSPLIEEPFLFAGVDALAAGDEKTGETLLTEARRRDPRSRTARLLLLDRYLRTNRAREAGVELAALNRLISRAAEALVPELARMARDPQTRTPLLGMLRETPAIQEAVLARLASDGADVDLILRIAEGSPASASGVPAWQPLLLAKLVEKGEVAQAHQLWRRFASIGSAADSTGPYDGRFQGKPGSPPFNWQLSAGTAGVAERTPTPSLQVEYYGRDRADLATQLLMLRPGRYQLTFRAEGDAPGEGSKLAWMLTCHGGGNAQLLEAPLIRITSRPQVVAAKFAVPPTNCAAQWLKLVGRPAEFPSAQSVAISELQIRPEAQ